MTQTELNLLIQEVVDELNETLDKKGQQYSSQEDRLRNFKDAAKFLDETPEEALLGMVTKHIIALKDFIHFNNYTQVGKEQWLEKTGDIINYMILLRALLRERGIV